MVAREYLVTATTPSTRRPSTQRMETLIQPAARLLNSLYTAYTGNMSDRNEGADVLSSATSRATPTSREAAPQRQRPSSQRRAGAATCFYGHQPVAPLREDGKAYTAHISELQHHYGDRLASHRETEIWFSQLGRDAFKSHAAVTEYVTELMREMWIPQTKLFIANQLRRRLQEGSSDTGSMPITLEQKEACKSAVEAWEAAPDAFTHVALQRLIDGLTSGGSRIKITLSRTRTRHDFATQLLRVVSTEKGRAASAPVNATWPDHLQAAITSGNQASNGLKPDEWVSVDSQQTPRGRC
ncbi:hypothetical protein CGCA056_v015154 [Colletotrichum aenigma]|uniref:uncharacterized protein n=1 Tax=Colletotrichum aenigma TaxID=1215731 RepID=UPI001872631E|nr:uncharacterized protein CGCA056_v015154 [Colletotrichum aenigma]KAF5483096.1 hypothetical protein CGCA056_v015154 [Colletotrichum aenigma]